jgi:hypothetical protein
MTKYAKYETQYTTPSVPQMGIGNQKVNHIQKKLMCSSDHNTPWRSYQFNKGEYSSSVTRI